MKSHIDADKGNQRTEFGIFLQDSLNTGFRPYTPGGGLKFAGWSISIYHQFPERWLPRGEASYEYFFGDVTDSPLVKDFGRNNQYELGIGIYYQFYESAIPLTQLIRQNSFRCLCKDISPGECRKQKIEMKQQGYIPLKCIFVVIIVWQQDIEK